MRSFNAPAVSFDPPKTVINQEQQQQQQQQDSKKEDKKTEGTFLIMTEQLWIISSVLALVLGILLGILGMFIRHNLTKGYFLYSSYSF